MASPPPPTSNALVRKRTDTELAVSIPPAKKIKRPKKVLDEDTYSEALSQIIARDFFPGLVETETQQEYLDALESKDREWISSAGRKLQEVMTPGRHLKQKNVKDATSFRHNGRTPSAYGGDTPASIARSTLQEKIRVKTNMSLGAFQTTYTSEDNESFYKLMDKQTQKRREKHGWLWSENKLPSKQMLKQKEVEERLSQTRSLICDGYKRDRLAIKDIDDRPARPDSWKSDPKNGLMFAPDGVDDERESPAQRAQAQSLMGPKMVVYENTRMPQPSMSYRPPSPTMSAVRDAIAGKPRPAGRDSTFGGGETPRVNGYSFVDDEDEPEESKQDLPVIDLGPGDTVPNPFTIRDQRKRESLHHRMVERMAQSKRESARNGLTGKLDRTPVPKFPNSPRVSGGGLTPAAQRLWSKIGKSKGRTPAATPHVATPNRAKGSLLKTVTKRST
jgi:protein DGCR14